MSPRLLADLLVVLHGAFVLFAVFGAFAAVRWPRLAWLHVPAVLWAGYVEIAGRVCPLTPLENRLRRIAGEGGYEGGFVERYLIPVIYPEALTRDFQLLLGAGVLLVNAAAYAWILRRARRP